MSQTKDEQARTQPAPIEEDLGELLKIRREKLAKLQAEGNNPYEITKFNPTHYSQNILEHFDEMKGSKSLWQAASCQKNNGKASWPIS